MTYSAFKMFLLLLGSLTLVSAKRQIVLNSPTLSVLCVDTNENENKVLSESQKPRTTPCPLPVSELTSGRHQPAAMGDYFTEPPEWLNVTLATIGQDYMRKNFVGYFYSVFLRTMLVISVTEAERILNSAAKGLTPQDIEKRYIANALNLVFYANADIGPGMHHPINAYRWNQSSLYEALNLIRSIHEKLGQQANVGKERFSRPGTSRGMYNVAIDNELWDALQKDLESSHLVPFKNKEISPKRNNITEFPFNQFSIALQFWAHMAGPFLNSGRSLFMANLTEEELLGYLHFWSFLAHVIGTSEEYNIGLQPSISAAKKYFREFFEEYFLPGLFRLEYESKVYLETYIKTFSGTAPFLDIRLGIKQLAEDILEIKTENLQKILSPQARLYSSIFRTARWNVKTPRINAGARFIMNGVIQVRVLDLFGYNTLVPGAFTNGLLQTNERILYEAELFRSMEKKGNVN